MATKFDFSSLSLEVIDTSLNATSDIFVNRNCITFTKRVLEDMNYAPYVQYCIDPKQHVFAIRACKGNESRAVPFSKPRAEQNNTLSCNIRSVRDIVALLIPDYNASKRYKVTGIYDAENKTMIFFMKEAVVSMFRRTEETAE